jgi:glycosyltransferase 2 family protein
MAFQLFIRAYRWQLLLDVHGSHIALPVLHRVTYISMFFNNFFLGSLSGDAFKIFEAAGYCSTKGEAASSVIMERVTGFLAALLMVIVFGGSMLLTKTTLLSVSVLVPLVCTTAAAIVLIFCLLHSQFLISRLPLLNHMPQAKRILTDIVASLAIYGRHRDTLFITLLLSGLFYAAQTLTVYCFTSSANAQVSFFPLLFIAPLVGLLALIPISVNGLGIQEGSYIFYLHQLGVPTPQALLMAVLARLALMLFSLLGGLIFLIPSSKPRLIPEPAEHKAHTPMLQ